MLRKFKNIKLVTLKRGYGNHIIFLEGTNPPLIAKVFEKNKFNEVQTERRALELLNDTGISPKIYDYFEYNTFSYIIMDFIEGLSGQALLRNGNINRMKHVYQLLGIHLAKEVHSIKRQEDNYKLSKIELKK